MGLGLFVSQSYLEQSDIYYQKFENVMRVSVAISTFTISYAVFNLSYFFPKFFGFLRNKIAE